MDELEEKQYHSWVRGAATFILLKHPNPPMDAQTIAQKYTLELHQVAADIDAIVQSEHAKVGGVFELSPGLAAPFRK